MTDFSSSFELVEFEQVQAGASNVLLRLAARSSESLDLAGVTLLIQGDGPPARIGALPAPPGPAMDPVRIAFSAAADLIGRGASFAIEMSDGSVVQLPAPARRHAIRGPAEAAAAAERRLAERRLVERRTELPDGPRIAETERRAAARRLAIVELQRRLSAEHQRRVAAETEARTARASATAEAAALVETRMRLADVENDAQRLKSELAAEAERLRSEIRDTTRDLEAQTETAGALRDRVGKLEAAARISADREAETRVELERTLATLAEIRDELADREGELDRISRELDEEQARHAEESAASSANADALRAQLIELECRLEDEQVRLENAEADVQAGREQFAGMELELAGVRAAAEEVASALADRSTEIELLREAAVSRERELESELGTRRREYELELSELEGATARAREEAETAKADAQAASEAVDVAKADADAARGAADAVRAELDTVHTELDAAHEDVKAAQADADAAWAETEELRAELDVAQRHVSELEAQLEQARETIEQAQQALVRRVAEVELLRSAETGRWTDAVERQPAAAQREPAAATEPATAEPATAEPATAEPAAAEPAASDEDVQRAVAAVLAAEAALTSRAAEVELLVTVLRERQRDAQYEAERSEAAVAEAQSELTALRDRLARAESSNTILRQQLDEIPHAQQAAGDAESLEREVVELRGAVERAQNRARLHRQHSAGLEKELAEAKQELTTLREQIAAVDGLSGHQSDASDEELEALREQVAYGEALAADLVWQLEEARATEEAAEAALAIRLAEVELLSLTLRERDARPADSAA